MDNIFVRRSEANNLAAHRCDGGSVCPEGESVYAADGYDAVAEALGDAAFELMVSDENGAEMMEGVVAI